MMAYPYATCFAIFSQIKETFCIHFPFFFTTRLKGGRHERGFGLFLKELNMDSLNRRLEPCYLQTTEALALLDVPHCPYHLRYPLGLGAKLLFFSQLKILRSERDVVAVREPTLPSWGRSQASIFFSTQKFKI